MRYPLYEPGEDNPLPNGYKEDDMDDGLQVEMDYQLLLYAVQRQIFCPVHDCGRVLDVRDASLFMAEGMPPSVLCTSHVPECFEPDEGVEWYTSEGVKRG